MGTKGTTRYRIWDQNALNYITIATVYWIDIFTRRIYKDIVINSLDYCRREKGLVLNAYVIMSNHLHIIVRAREGFKLSNIIRDFKRHTAKRIIKEIKENIKESRTEWILELLQRAGAENSKNKMYQFWRQDNHPIELYTNTVIEEKLNYIHNNPVKAGVVENSEDYLFSSARNYAEMEALIEIDLL